MSVSLNMVPGDQYLGGLLKFLYRAIRGHLFLIVALPLVAMGGAYFAALQSPTVYRAQGSIRVGKVEGADTTSVGAVVSRMNSPSFMQGVVQKMNLSGTDGSRSAQLIFASLTARQTNPDKVAVTLNAATAQQGRDAVVAAVALLSEEHSRIWGPLEADIKEQLAASDATIAGLQTMKKSLSGLLQEHFKEPAGAPVSTVLERLWLTDLILRNEQRLAAITAERRALSSKLTASTIHSTALVDDVFISSGFAYGRPSMIAILAGAVMFLLCLMVVLLRSPGVNRWVGHHAPIER